MRCGEKRRKGKIFFLLSHHRSIGRPAVALVLCFEAQPSFQLVMEEPLLPPGDEGSPLVNTAKPTKLAWVALCLVALLTNLLVSLCVEMKTS